MVSVSEQMKAGLRKLGRGGQGWILALSYVEKVTTNTD